jgi:hypothetical protein
MPYPSHAQSAAPEIQNEQSIISRGLGENGSISGLKITVVEGEDQRSEGVDQVASRLAVILVAKFDGIRRAFPKAAGVGPAGAG